MRWAARVPWAALAAIQQAQGSAAYSCDGLIIYSNSGKRIQIIVQSPCLRFKPPHEALYSATHLQHRPCLLSDSLCKIPKEREVTSLKWPKGRHSAEGRRTFLRQRWALLCLHGD